MLPPSEQFSLSEIELLQFIERRLQELEAQLKTLQPWEELKAIGDEVENYHSVIEAMGCNRARAMN
jgi:DNA-binding transcriptional MerR regulator